MLPALGCILSFVLLLGVFLFCFGQIGKDILFRTEQRHNIFGSESSAVFSGKCGGGGETETETGGGGWGGDRNLGGVGGGRSGQGKEEPRRKEKRAKNDRG